MDTLNDQQPAPHQSRQSVAAEPSTMNRTYLQCYSREANKNLVNWADQMSMALRDSVAHLDQICMRVRSCLSDLEANEIRYLHMQRRPSPLQMYQPTADNSLPVEVPDEIAHKEIELNATVIETEAPIEIESLPADTPVIVEPLAVQESAKPPSKNVHKRPKSRRGSATSCSRPTTQTSLIERKTSKCPSCRKIASVKALKPIISVREHLELTKDARPSARQVYKKIFRTQLGPLQNSTTPIMRLPPPPLISRPRSILKMPNKFSTKPVDINIKLPGAEASTVENTLKNKESQKFNDSLWFKEKKSSSQCKMHDQCACKVIVECPRVSAWTTPRGSYNAQSRLQWIRAKNSLVLEYGKTHAIDNQRQTATADATSLARTGPPTDILDEINDELVRPLQSEYPRKDCDVPTSAEGRRIKEEWADGAGGGNELLRELLQDTNKLKGLVQSTSHRILSYKSPHIFNKTTHHRLSPCPTPVIKHHTPPYTTQSPPQQLDRQRARRHKKKQQHQQLLKQRTQVLDVGGEAGDLMLVSNVSRSKSGRRRSGSGSGSRSGKEDKENVGPVKTDTGFRSWTNMSPHEIKSKLLPFLIPEQRLTYTVLPVTEIIYDKKPPMPGLPPTSVSKGMSGIHLNSTQPSAHKRTKPRSLYTDARTQRKLDSYLELRDNSAYYKPLHPTTYTTLPAITITTPPPNFSSRHSAHPHHHYHPRRSPSDSQQPHRGTANPYHRRHCTTTASGPSSQVGDQRQRMMDGVGSGGMLLDKARKAKAAISAATRRDIGSSIQELEDKIAELISDPSKIGDGKAFDDVEQDIVRMLNKISPSQDEGDAASTSNAEDIGTSQVSTSSTKEVNCQAEMVSSVTMESAINLTESTQMTDIAGMMSKSTEDTNREAHTNPKLNATYDVSQPKKFAPVPCDAMEITAGLNQVEKILDPNQKTESNPQHKTPKKEPSLQPIYENIEPSQIGTPRKVFKIENIPEYADIDRLSQISNFPCVTNLKKQTRDDSADSKISLSGPELKRLKKLDGTRGKAEQEFIVSTDNLCSIESDQFVTPFMKVVRKYRKEDTHDNFMQFLEALTQLSQDNATVFGDTNTTKLKMKEYSKQDLSNPFFNDMKDAQVAVFSKDAIDKKKAQLQSSAMKVMTNQPNLTCCFNEARAVWKKTDNICSQLAEYILNSCKSCGDKQFIMEKRDRCETSTTRGLMLRFFYTILFVVVFFAMKWNWHCIS